MSQESREASGILTSSIQDFVQGHPEGVQRYNVGVIRSFDALSVADRKLAAMSLAIFSDNDNGPDGLLTLTEFAGGKTVITRLLCGNGAWSVCGMPIRESQAAVVASYFATANVVVPFESH